MEIRLGVVSRRARRPADPERRPEPAAEAASSGGPAQEPTVDGELEADEFVVDEIVAYDTVLTTRVTRSKEAQRVWLRR